MIAELATATHFAFRFVGKNEIDIRGQVQFTGTELAHGQHHHPDFIALLIDGRTVFGAGTLVQPIEGTGNQGISKQAEIGHGVGKIAATAEVAPDNAAHMTMTKHAQRRVKRRLVITGRQFLLQLCRQLARVQAFIKRRLRQPLHQRRTSRHLLGDIIGTGPDARQLALQ